MVNVLFIFGAVLIVWGIYRMKTDDGLFGENRKSKNIFNLMLMGEASGLGQFLSGILCIIIAIIAVIMK
ncbi:hypothetical protein IFT92_23905 [Peribacillus simplex]|uniref:hypothetical protein n=1 Tax=Bacillaceae TaxID=186817 RepID=UPI00065FC36D|nr:MULTISPECIES: hypothetical protein [Bacillaceae]MCP1097132.1 hypothetical protein [Bacillaceae bacterium OS4b]MBD8590787.1 hypothetical protein [Peribacillus simplex]MCF7624535.1 hypothetical protein [Peribacillus frigoritolerans]MEA3577568.1 hypothetical protein [Peribacillus frigoritolerans]PRA75517.1 hypothetical protein CQ056_26900 [Peribacillus simplex]